MLVWTNPLCGQDSIQSSVASICGLENSFSLTLERMGASRHNQRSQLAASNEPESSTRRGATKTRSVAMYSMAMSLFALIQVGKQHQMYLTMMNDVPDEMTDGRPVEVDKAAFGKSENASIGNTSIDNTSIEDHSITLISNGNTNSVDIGPIPVVVWPFAEYGPKTAVSRHLEENGIKESSHLEWSTDMSNFDPNVVWVGDLGSRSCKMFHKRVMKAKEKRAELGLALQWPIFIIDWTDFGKSIRCNDIEKEMGKDFVKYSQRSIVKGRKWVKDESWVKFGEVVLKESVQANRRHMPYFVRTDTVEMLDYVLKEQYKMALSSPIETLERPIDVAHYWPLNMKGVRNIKCNLRKKVSKVVFETGKEANLTTFVQLAGKAVKKGRKNVKSAYVEAMLEAKIIIATQRDAWEDHYRLMEALVSGAMVMTDRMLSLPHGLENGTSVIEFDSAEDLRTKILYYSSHPEERLEIARKGREIAMTQHRTWHRIEEVIFGRAITGCANATRESLCPYVVHANETLS